MTHLVIFYVAQLLASAYAIARGGAPERIVAWTMIAAAVATSITSMAPNLFAEVNRGQLIVDLAFMAVAAGVALRADRFWPMVIAGLHLLGILIHGVRAYDPHILPVVYARAPAALAYPMLLILVIGTWRFVRRSQRPGGTRDWSPFKW